MTCTIVTLFSHAGRELAEKNFYNRRPTHGSLSFKSDVENETQHSEAWNGKHHAVAVLMNIVMSYEICNDNVFDWDFESQPPALHLLCSLKWLLMNFGRCVLRRLRQTFTPKARWRRTVVQKVVQQKMVLFHFCYSELLKLYRRGF